MSGKSEMVKQIDFIIITRRIKLLGYAIITGIVLIYVLGVIVSETNVNSEKSFLNTPVTILGIILCTVSFYIRKTMLKKVNKDNFITAYFNAHIAAFIFCDFGALISITTNLFVNVDILMATIGAGMGAFYMWLNFPKDEEISYLN